MNVWMRTYVVAGIGFGASTAPCGTLGQDNWLAVSWSRALYVRHRMPGRKQSKLPGISRVAR